MFILDRRKKEIWLALINFLVLIVAMILFLRTIDSNGIWEEPILSVALFFIFPILFIKFFLRQKPKEYFLDTKQAKNQIEWALSSALVFIFIIWLIVLNWKELAVIRQNESIKLVLFVNTFLLPIAVFSQEFFFRGFLLKIFSRNWSSLTAIATQATLFTGFKLLTNVEINNLWRLLALWVISFLLGIIALRFRSVIVSAVVYWAYLFLVDLYVLYGLNQILLKTIIEKNF